ncbi:hypothetical protein K470DRAFT_254858 [Piedraia hortae CBS 480.64]|uniref:Uncharacterized protein n=1 Tax=Piedraia hortae CBS 480.64 TaxID=1314780 RepID=A0A6A7CAC1_9PEZI|nr:hypothetical protein K470DRAFT_254858 [Piedraia hortae CBS 480.64]
MQFTQVFISLCTSATHPSTPFTPAKDQAKRTQDHQPNNSDHHKILAQARSSLQKQPPLQPCKSPSKDRPLYTSQF